MANAYLDNYSLDGAPRRKADLYNYLNTNRDKLNLTPEEEYKFNWGSEAVSDDWITQKAKSIQQEIEDSNSTAILRRGLGNSKAASDEVTDEIEAGKTPEEIEAEKAKAAREAVTERNGGDHDFGGGKNPATPGHEASSAWGLNQYGINPGFSTTGAKLGSLAGPLGAVAGGIALGTSLDPLGEFAYDALVAQENRDIATNTTAAQMTSMQNALNEDAAALGAMQGNDTVSGGLSAKEGPGSDHSSHDDAGGDDGSN